MADWSKEQLEIVLRDKGWFISSRDIEHAVQFELTNGVKINLYQTGTVRCVGRNSSFKSEVEAFVNAGTTGTTSDISTRSASEPNLQAVAETKRRVFVVYGHDIDARDDLELILRRFQLNPIILENIPVAGETLIEKLESLTKADFACVLLTPDDTGKANSSPDEPLPRARQNVVLEMGMVLSRLGRNRVVILVKGHGLEKPSDIDGLIYIPFDEKVGEAANELGAALESSGFTIRVKYLLGS